MLKIGLIVAIEMEPVFSFYKDYRQLDCPPGFKLYQIEKENRTIFVLQTGMGEIAAASGVQYLCSAHHVDLIINYGVVGGLSEDMSKYKICVVDRVVHYKYDCSEFMDLAVGQLPEHDSVYLPTDRQLIRKALEICPELISVTCCSGDKFVGTAEEKKQIRDRFEGDVCDMESAGIVLACEINQVPCLLLKAVSDGLSGGADEFYTELLGASRVCLNTADKIIGNL